MKTDFIEIILGSAVLLFGLCCIFLTLHFVKNFRSKLLNSGKVPSCPLDLVDLLVFSAAVAWALTALPTLWPAVSVGLGLLLFLRHGTTATGYWSIEASDILPALANGLKIYLTLLIPLAAITWISFKIGARFGYDDAMQPSVKAFLEMKNPADIASFLFMACIIAPLCEEIAFRGILYPFLKNHTGIKWAMLLSSLVWAAIHLYPPVIAPLLFLGCALVYVYENTGKLGYCIALHAVFNSSTCLILILYKYGALTAL